MVEIMSQGDHEVQNNRPISDEKTVSKGVPHA